MNPHGKVHRVVMVALGVGFVTCAPALAGIPETGTVLDNGDGKDQRSIRRGAFTAP